MLTSNPLWAELTWDKRLDEGPRDGLVARLALLRVNRTAFFLETCLTDFETASAAFFENFDQMQAAFADETRPIAQRDLVLLDEAARISAVVQFRIETFYFFAQRILDEVVTLMDAFFPRGATTLGRQRTLRKNLSSWLSERGLEEPSEMGALIEDVTRRVKDFRDDHVAHIASTDHVRKTPGLLWGKSGDLLLRISWMAQRSDAEELGAESEQLSELTDLLNTYLGCVLEFLSRALSNEPVTK